MPAVNRCWLVAAALLCVPAPVAQAQARRRRVTSLSARSRLRPATTNASASIPTSSPIAPEVPCRRSGSWPRPPTAASPSKRGTLKATNFKQCLAAEVPALLAFYRSAANFNGSDEFELEITLQGGRKQVQHFRVDVSASPAGGGGKGI